MVTQIMLVISDCLMIMIVGVCFLIYCKNFRNKRFKGKVMLAVMLGIALATDIVCFMYHLYKLINN